MMMRHKYRRLRAEQELEQSKLRSFKRDAILRDHTDLVSLVAPQPQSEISIILPATIKIGMSWRNHVIMWGLLGGPIILLGLIIFQPWATLFSIQSLAWLIYLAASLITVSTIGGIATYERINVDESGLTISRALTKAVIRWDEACIFAIDAGVLYSDFAKYELARSQDDFISWTRLHNTMLISPSISYNEYNKQMDALLAYIVKKTNLPLYDLR